MSDVIAVIRRRSTEPARARDIAPISSRAIRPVRAFVSGDVGDAPANGDAFLGFIGSGLRLPVATATRSGSNYVAGDMAMGMPSWEVDELYFFFPTFACPVSAEVHCPNGYTIEGIATRASGGQRTLGQIDDGTASIVIDPADSAMTNGKWVKFTPASPIAADSVQVFSFAQYVPDGLYPQSRVATTATANIFGGTTKDERSQQSTSSLLSTLSGSSDYTTSSKHVVYPAACMARKPNGEISALVLGTSICYGAHQTNSANVMTDRHGFGYMEMALDDNDDSDRIGYLNWGIPGWGHESTGADNSQGNATKCARQLWALEKARELNGDRPLVDALFCEHGTNTSGDQTSLRADYRTLYALWLDVVGTASGSEKTPVYQAEMLPYPQTTDAYQTLGNQTVTTANEYPTGVRWLINADIGGADGLGDASANLRADGSIQGSFAPWRETAYDTSSERDKLSVRAFSTTLASDYAGSGTISLTDEPTLGDKLMMDDGSNTADFVVLSYTGSGPYTVTPQFFSGSGTSFTAASTDVQSVWHDAQGLHPSPLGHIAYKASLVALKVALGWEAPLAAPTINSASISGTAEDGQMLTAVSSVSGNPTPTLSYQWQNNGTNISGETGSTITLDEAGMSLTDSDTISVEITATNSEGSDTAEPTVSYTGSPTSLYDTSDLVLTTGNAAHSETIDTDSFRLARQSGEAMALFDITDGGVNGSKRIRLTPSAYDGTATGITLIRVQIKDGTTVVLDIQSTTAVDVTHTFTSGTISFNAPTNGRGGRLDNLLITDAS